MNKKINAEEKKLGENDTFNVGKDVNDIAKCLLPHILMHTKSTHTLIQIAGKKIFFSHTERQFEQFDFFSCKKRKTNTNVISIVCKNCQ